MRQIYTFTIAFSILLLVLFHPKVNAQVTVQDSLALVDLYNSTGGAGWFIRTNWLSNQPVGTWHGVGVDNGRVLRIDLSVNNLTGTLPASLGTLTGLTSLELDVNKISGNIPDEIGNLTNLNYLSIITNLLSGSVPASLGKLSNLTWLRLADNQLSGQIPPELGNLSNLMFFYLGNNQFTGIIPPELGNLSNLLYLQVYLNQLTGTIPSSLGKLSKLQDLEVAVNQLTGSIPASIGNITTLNTLNVYDNQLSGEIPASIASHSYLNLYLHRNQFTFAGMEAIAVINVWQRYYSPQADLPVTNNCGVLSVSAGGTPSNNTYRWFTAGGDLQSTKTGDSTFTPAAPGIYYAAVSNKIATDLTLYSQKVSSGLVTNTLSSQLCPGQSYTLPSGMQVGTSGVYHDTVRYSGGCGDSLITILTLTAGMVGRSSVSGSLCPGQSYTLPSGNTVGAAGVYNDTLRSAGGCDSVIRIITLRMVNPVIVNKNIVLCMGQSFVFPSGLTAGTPGNYHDTLRSVAQGCDSLITNAIITTDPSVQQVKDTLALCNAFSTQQLIAGTAIGTYIWSTGATSNAITVSQPGVYTVSVNSSKGCVAQDTFSVISSPAASLALDKNIVLCKGEPKQADAGAGYQQYLWNTGSTQQSISVRDTGTYWVTVTDEYQCQDTDTTKIERTTDKPSLFLPADTAVCRFGEPLAIRANTSFITYQWSTGETVPEVFISKPGLYSLTVTDGNNCTGIDQILVKEKECLNQPFVPGAFTPGSDGLNDVFRPVGLNSVNLLRYRFTIYNRWGQLVYHSSNPAEGWRGNSYATAQDATVYTWFLEYQYNGASVVNKKGTVVLIR